MATTRREFKLGIVGCGRISQTYIQAIKDCPHCQLVAVMDVRPESVQAAAEAGRNVGAQSECKAFTGLDEFIEGCGADGVIVCSPPSTHREVACKALQVGIHVLCEKPFATRYDDALAMVNAAREADLVLMMASKFRYAEDIIRAKAIVASGMLGTVQFYENKFCSKTDMRQRWNSDPEIAGGGVIIDNGTHSVDIVRYLLGPIRWVNAQEGKRINNLPVEETACLSLVTENEVMGNVNLSWSMTISQEDYIEIYGTEGVLKVGWQSSRYQHLGHQQWVAFGVGYNKIEAFKNQVKNFIESVRGSAQPLISEEEGLASVEVIEAAYQSLKTRNWVQVEGKASCQRHASAM